MSVHLHILLASFSDYGSCDTLPLMAVSIVDYRCSFGYMDGFIYFRCIVSVIIVSFVSNYYYCQHDYGKVSICHFLKLVYTGGK